MVGRDAEPCVAMPRNLLAQVPGRHVGANTGVTQIIGCHPMLAQFLEVHGIHLADAHVDGPVVVLANGGWVQIRFHLQDGPQNVLIHLVVVRGRQDAPLNFRREWSRARHVLG